MVSSAPSDRPPEAVVSDVRKSNSSSMSDTPRGSITFNATVYRKDNQTGRQRGTKYLTSAFNRTVPFKDKFDDCTYDAASFFQQPTYRARISEGQSPNTSLTVSSLLDKETGPNQKIKTFLLQDWNEFMKSIKLPQLQTGTHEVVTIENCMPLFICEPDLRVQAWFEIVKSLAVDVLLGSAFVYRYIIEIFPTEHKIVPYDLKPVTVISTNHRLFQ